MFCCSVPKPSATIKIREFPREYCRVMGLPRTELAWPNWVSWPPSQEEKEREKQLNPMWRLYARPRPTNSTHRTTTPRRTEFIDRPRSFALHFFFGSRCGHLGPLLPLCPLLLDLWWTLVDRGQGVELEKHCLT